MCDQDSFASCCVRPVLPQGIIVLSVCSLFWVIQLLSSFGTLVELPVGAASACALLSTPLGTGSSDMALLAIAY